ncbi:hypothetical protein TNCV_940521 [Trichonephila clavipes]|nr:hypothetical protein TNCV_940521 [Trichonephila clavipes]
MVNALLCENLTFKLNHWEPHKLTAGKTEEKGGGPIWFCSEENILNRIVTCDEKVMYFNSTSHSGRWSAPKESSVFIMDDNKKHENKAGGNFDRSSKARRGVMDALSAYQKLLTERKRKAQITLDDFLIQRQKIGNTEDTVLSEM